MKKNNLLIFVLSVVLLLSVFSCAGGSEEASTPAPSIPETTTYTVTNSGASDYVFNSVVDPTLTLRRGTTYTFNLSVSGHPFYIKTAQVTGVGSAYNDGVTTNGAETGVFTFVVPMTAPNTLYYICSLHASMTGIINIIN